MSEGLTDESLALMRQALQGEDEPASDEWFDMVDALLDEVARLKKELVETQPLSKEAIQAIRKEVRFFKDSGRGPGPY